MRPVYVAGYVLLLLLVGFSGYRVIVFAYNSPQLEVRRVRVAGANRISDTDVLRGAGYRPGASTLRLDLAEMREGVEGISWVRNASVQRVWPNEIVISVVERIPIALARIEGQIFQVDEDGVVLPADAAAAAAFPILDGIVVGDFDGNASKIDVYSKIIDEIGDNQLSEVHVDASGEVSVVPSADPILVALGSENHLERWQRFLRLRDRIREDYPGASRIDLRFRDQVIVQTRETQSAEGIVWGEKERL